MKNRYEPYRPSNEIEGAIFIDRYCWYCSRNDECNQCPILSASMDFNIDDPNYPPEFENTVAMKRLKCLWRKNHE
jgi:hypothetical protein